MRRSRKKKPKHVVKIFYRVNEKIRVPEVRVVGDDNEHIGVMSTDDARALAKERELDLVEINPKSRPPICKLIEYGQFKYQAEKEARTKMQNKKVGAVKGVRISARIGPGDKEIRLKQALKFFGQGNKVKVELIMRGRENAQRARAFEIVKDFIAELSTLAEVTVEQDVKQQANKITALLAGKIAENKENSEENEQE